jgi:hypothetical protein
VFEFFKIRLLFLVEGVEVPSYRFVIDGVPKIDGESTVVGLDKKRALFQSSVLRLFRLVIAVRYRLSSGIDSSGKRDINANVLPQLLLIDSLSIAFLSK